jgi:hypothetical protein
VTDFWLSCGHHLLDRDAGGGLVATDEFLKAYLARPSWRPSPEAGIIERTLRRRRSAPAGGRARNAALDDPDARENWS